MHRARACRPQHHPLGMHRRKRRVRNDACGSCVRCTTALQCTHHAAACSGDATALRLTAPRAAARIQWRPRLLSSKNYVRRPPHQQTPPPSSRTSLRPSSSCTSLHLHQPAPAIHLLHLRPATIIHASCFLTCLGPPGPPLARCSSSAPGKEDGDRTASSR